MNQNEESMPFFTDKVGRDVRVGDYIIYGNLLGRSAGLRFGKVLKIFRGAHPYRADEFEWRITVIGIDDHSSFREPRLNERKGCLLYPERILGVNNLIPDNYKEMLDESE